MTERPTEPGPAETRAVATVAAVFDEHLPERGLTVVVAVSGGPDSVALLHLAVAARPDLRLVVVHVRHGLRDDRADASAARANAVRLGTVYCERDAVLHEGDGPEDRARRGRYAALCDVARQRRAAAILVGHTADDQAETVLLRIARGTGLRGLGGMAAATRRDGILLLRPLLACRRADVRAVAAAHPSVEDPTNTDRG